MADKVKIYTTPTCPYCTTLKKFLANNDVEFEEVDVSKDKQALKEMKQKSGQMGVPTSEIGDQVIVGFDKKKIKQVLDL